MGVLLKHVEQFVPRSRQAQPAPNPATQSASVLQSAQTAGPVPQNMSPFTFVWQMHEGEGVPVAELLQFVAAAPKQKSVPAKQVPAPPLPATQVPLVHVSPAGQTFPQEPQLLVVVSSVHVPLQQIPPVQADPLAFAGLEQVPDARSQVPASWHSSRAVQTTAVPAQLPSAWQTSPVVQRLPSSHGAPTLTVNPQ